MKNKWKRITRQGRLSSPYPVLIYEDKDNAFKIEITFKGKERKPEAYILLNSEEHHYSSLSHKLNPLFPPLFIMKSPYNSRIFKVSGMTEIEGFYMYRIGQPLNLIEQLISDSIFEEDSEILFKYNKIFSSIKFDRNFLNEIKNIYIKYLENKFSCYLDYSLKQLKEKFEDFKSIYDTDYKDTIIVNTYKEEKKFKKIINFLKNNDDYVECKVPNIININNEFKYYTDEELSNRVSKDGRQIKTIEYIFKDIMNGENDRVKYKSDNKNNDENSTTDKLVDNIVALMDNIFILLFVPIVFCVFLAVFVIYIFNIQI